MRKGDLNFILSGLLVVAAVYQPYAQKIMKLDSSLAANATMVPVKIKPGITTGPVMKYEFGPYKVISSKAGWGSSVSKSRLFSRVETTESKSKANFKLQCGTTDTIEANLFINMNSTAFRENYFSIGKIDILFGPDEEPGTKFINHNVTAVFYSKPDTAEWTLMYIYRLNRDSSVNVKKYGFLTNGTFQIEINEVRAWGSGKEHSIYLTKGFEFYLGGKAITAVQCPVNTFQKKFVWLSNDINEEMKNVLAAAATVLIGYNEAVEPDAGLMQD